MFRYSSIKDYHNALQNGQTTCVEAVRFYVDAIAARPGLNAYLEVFAQEALAKAAELDAHRATGATMGKLHGVVVGIKDVICYKGHAVSAGSKILENFTSVYNATAVEKLLEEEAIIIGRQNCDEFAMGSSSENSAFGPVRNALDESRVPGGSSGGSAVSIQAGLSMVSLGSDTGGSVRQPADFCGVVGLKPSYGRISRYGLIAYASSFDQIGIFAQSVDDAALVLEVISGKDNFDSTVSQQEVPAFSKIEPTKTYKIAYFKQALENPGLDPEIRTAVQGLIEQLRIQGVQVDPIEFNLLDQVVPTYYVLTTAEASSNLSRFDGVRYGHRTSIQNVDLNQLYKASRTEGFGKEVQRRILLGTFVLSSGYFDAYFTKAQQVRRILWNKANEVFKGYDLLISPTVPAPAFKLGEKSDDQVAMFLADIYTVFANLVGIPAISIPLFQHSNGMPFGLQLMSSHFQESDLLQFSAQLMAAKPSQSVK